MTDPRPDAAEEFIIRADRQTYIRDHLVMAGLGALLAMGVLVAMGDPNVWVGLVGACVAIAVRGFYLASEELAVEWRIADGALRAPGRHIALKDVADVRTILSAVQVVARDGNKYLIKYQPDPRQRAAEIRGFLP
jgi:hypothetical protein